MQSLREERYECEAGDASDVVEIPLNVWEDYDHTGVLATLCGGDTEGVKECDKVLLSWLCAVGDADVDCAAAPCYPKVVGVDSVSGEDRNNIRNGEERG